MVFTEWEARHGMSADQLQNVFNELNEQGYRLVKVSVYERNNAANYAGVWHKRGGNEWQARNGLSAARYQAAVDEFDGRGMRPTHISVANVDGEPTFTAIWERQPGLPWEARHDLTPDEYQALFSDLSSKGFRPRCLAGYEADGEPRFACVWDQYEGPPWQAWHGLTAEEYQAKFNDLADKGFRIVQLCGYSVGGTPYYAGIWEESLGHGLQARHGLSAGDYQASFDEMVGAGYRLVDVSGFAARRGTLFTTIWEDGAPDIPNPADLSGKAIPFMQKYAVPGMSLCFAREGHIVGSRCFGYANPMTRQICIPETRFRIASISKPITAVAIFKLIEEGRFNLSDKVFGAGGLLGTIYGTQPYKPGITDITLEQLLQHTSGGWLNDENDPMFQDATWDMTQLINYTLDNQGLTDTPGTNYAYSNFGYCLLGRIIETFTGESYENHVRNAILSLCGAGGMCPAGNAASNRFIDEALYVGAGHQNPYDMNVSRMDSHGGWLATASEVVHFALAVDNFDFPADLLQASTLTTMTTASSVNPGYACGWSVNASNNWWHTGGLPGTRTILVRTSGYRAWAALCNTRDDDDEMGAELDSLMWELEPML